MKAAVGGGSSDTLLGEHWCHCQEVDRRSSLKVSRFSFVDLHTCVESKSRQTWPGRSGTHAGQGIFEVTFQPQTYYFLNHLYKSVTLSCNRTVRSAAWSQTSLHWVNGRGVIATLGSQWIIKMTLESAFWWRRSAQIRFILQVSNWNWRLDSPHT